jgi:hypothetical protein
MNDDQMDDLLLEGVRDYNAPRAVPREEMWNRIAAARAERRTVTTPQPARRSAPAARWTAIGIAAAVILAVGITIGRSLDRGAVRPAVVARAAVDSVPQRTDAAPASTPTVVATAPSSRDSLIDALRTETTKTDRRVRELATASPRESGAGRRASDEASLAYHLVVMQHLAGSEAMITAFRTGAKRGEMDAQLARWSRDLLSTTRLLESSQASDDPVMKRLLGDLDLVISQIVQYTARGVVNNDELDLIEQTINKRGVMTKLRSTNPGRGVAAGT